jgi:hypothetical protein
VALRALALVLLLGGTCFVAASSAADAATGAASGQTHAAGLAGSPSTASTPNAGGELVPSAAANAAQPLDGGTGGTGGSDATTASGTSTSSASASPRPSSNIGTGVSTSSPAATAWLTEINRYRTAAGLLPVVDQPSWDAGILAHLNYVARTSKSNLTGPYASLHTENPASPSYTSAGALEASRSDLFFDSSDLTPTEFIDGWLSAPFHAIGMLRGRLTQVAFASTANGGAAGLDVISGLGNSGPTSGPILFPGNGMTTDLTTYTGGESPDPLETCGWSARSGSYGLPLIALLPNAPKAGLAAQVTGTDGSVLSTANGQLCVVDELTYHSSDAVYGNTGKEILQDDHAVLLIARHPYVAATYTATISQPGQSDIGWSFTAAP